MLLLFKALIREKKGIELKISEKLDLLVRDPFHPSLRTHKLKGKLSGAWACTVEFDRPIGLRFMELCDYLEECLGREVDVLTLTGVQHIRNPNVSRSILEGLVYV